MPIRIHTLTLKLNEMPLKSGAFLRVWQRVSHNSMYQCLLTHLEGASIGPFCSPGMNKYSFSLFPLHLCKGSAIWLHPWNSVWASPATESAVIRVIFRLQKDLCFTNNSAPDILFQEHKETKMGLFWHYNKTSIF